MYLVGAGPGHPELLTLKAAALLRTGDVIVYDRLVQEEVLSLAKPSAERIYLGKTPGRHDSRQDEIHELLVRKAREGRMVVRLKGGDPFLFGRGGEEAEYLAEHGVPFEVVPGVSSALAAPECAGIAVTHRDTASAVAIVTGHEASREESRINWDALVGIDTLVFLMGVNNTGRIARELMARGRSPETPAAMIQMAFWHGERVVDATLGTIEEEVLLKQVVPPATLVIGESVRLREKLRQSQRDLLRRPDDGPAFEPAPGPEQLLRLATGGLASQILRLALAADLFGRLESWCTSENLARELHWDKEAAGEVLRFLVAQGLIESGPAGYRNLELASRYLLESSPQSLTAALQHQASLADYWPQLCRFAVEGGGAELTGDGDGFQKSLECLSRFAAPWVIDKADLSGYRRVLIAGWAGETYARAALRRWPRLKVEIEDTPSRVGDGEPCDAILLTGFPGSRDLEAVVPRLVHGGTLLLHDGLFSSPEAAAVSMGSRLAGREPGWSLDTLRHALDRLGVSVVRTDPIPGGSLLVTARRS